MWLSSGKVREGLASFEATKKITFVRTTFFKSGWSEVARIAYSMAANTVYRTSDDCDVLEV